MRMRMTHCVSSPSTVTNFIINNRRHLYSMAISTCHLRIITLTLRSRNYRLQRTHAMIVRRSNNESISTRALQHGRGLLEGPEHVAM